MDGVGTPIIGRPRPLPGHDTPNPANNTYTLNYEEPANDHTSTPDPQIRKASHSLDFNFDVQETEGGSSWDEAGICLSGECRECLADSVCIARR